MEAKQVFVWKTTQLLWKFWKIIFLKKWIFQIGDYAKK